MWPAQCIEQIAQLAQLALGCRLVSCAALSLWILICVMSRGIWPRLEYKSPHIVATDRGCASTQRPYSSKGGNDQSSVHSGAFGCHRRVPESSMRVFISPCACPVWKQCCPGSDEKRILSGRCAKTYAREWKFNSKSLILTWNASKMCCWCMSYDTLMNRCCWESAMSGQCYDLAHFS